MERFIVSARKYRPQTFDTVVGQEHITTTLRNAIRNEQLAHAFLFCGPRGVGKTTCARILAKTINCENRTPDGEACNECHSCVTFNNGTSLNIHELDAASNNSVEDIRSLVDQVRFAPQSGRYKVYIIDEVHMLSQSAFNAFLKTLEEPPPYAIFILATTEKHKILPTILSRCQIFDFKRITLQDTVDHLQGIARKENITAAETALQLIAQKSEGCMRDALSILDKIVSFTNGEVTYENTIEHLNILDEDYYFRLFDSMQKQDLAGAMLLYDDINKKGFEGDMVLNGFAEFIRNLLICKDERVSSLLEVVESFRQRYVIAAQQADAAYLVSALNILNDAEIGFRSARNKRLHVELALIRLCYLQQAIRLTSEDGNTIKKKLTDAAKPLAFRTIQPVQQKPAPATVAAAPVVEEKAKLIIEGAPVEKPKVAPKPAPVEASTTSIPAPVATAPAAAVSTETAAPPVSAPRTKLASLEAIRQKMGHTGGSQKAADQGITMNALQETWSAFVQVLKNAKNPAWQSFETAELRIRDDNSFEAVVTNNINQKFLEFERNKACTFLQQELKNRVLQFTIILEENTSEKVTTDVPLSSREQYQKIIEQYPLVKELKERLRLDLDY
ncbi:MAG TPA: DNA polymerase III subunit gamma/tau [Flavisolibacter sp.]